MEIKELLESINLCIESKSKACGKCRYNGTGSCAVNMMTDAVKAMEAQQQRIAELEAELKDERYRHDRLQDFEVAESEELRLAKEQLKRFGCDTCQHETRGINEYPCSECFHVGGIDNKWEWRKPEVDYGN